MDENSNQEIKKRRTWLWVVGWIFAFPIALTVLMLKSPRTAKLSIVLRVLIVIAGWILFFFLVLGSLLPVQKEDARSGEAQVSAASQAATWPATLPSAAIALARSTTSLVAITISSRQKTKCA